MSGRLIRVLREAARLSQQEVAERCGLGQQRISQVECDIDVSAATVKRIMAAIWQAPGTEPDNDATQPTAELHAEFDACFDAFRAVIEALKSREGDRDVLGMLAIGLVERAKGIGRAIDHRLADRKVH